MRDIKKIIIHCADTPNGRETHASDIDRWHKERGWRCIGYHFVIALDGAVENGRPVSEEGAHCYGHNADSIGICMIGCDRFTAAQWASLYHLIANLMSQFPDASVHGHYEFSRAKSCPNFDVHTWLTERRRIEAMHLLEVQP